MTVSIRKERWRAAANRRIRQILAERRAGAANKRGPVADPGASTR